MDVGKRVAEIFDRLVDLSLHERQSVLDEECGEDPSVAARVQALLAAHDEMGSFLSATASERSQPWEPAPGDHIGEYRLERLLGRGGGGTVFEARVAERVPGLQVGDRVALKVVHPHLLDSPGFFRRFLREVRLGQSVESANVVRTIDCSQVPLDGSQRAFLVMEYVEGQSLRELKEELGQVPEELCRHVAREICRGLIALHDAGVVHRDLKPANVLITEDHAVKVMDLGVARLADERLRLSRSGVFVGTVEYAAPEQFSGGEVDARCDLHAVGLLLYELASGVHPYRGECFPDVMRRVCEEQPRRIGQVHPQLTAFFEEVLHRLLAKKAEDRFASAQELLSVLEEGEGSAWWRGRAQEIRSVTGRPLRRIRIPRETAVYGRERELARLRELYDEAARGEGRVVLVEGEAGIGKTRLVDEFVGRLQADGEDFDVLIGSYPPGGAATASGAFSTGYREHLGDAGCAAYLTRSPILVPAFDALLRGESAPVDAEPLTKDSLQTCFVNVTRALAEERTIVVVIDDLHFAPAEGRALFAALAMALSEHRVLLVGTARPGLTAGWRASLERFEHVTQMPVERLFPKDLVELLRDSFRSEHLVDSLSAKIAVKSDGNPFFVFEIIRGLREGQFITQRPDGSWVSTSVIEEIQVPSSVLDLVNARVADLSETERDLLDVASCSGFEFDATLIGDALGRSHIPTLKQFAQMEKRHRLVRCAGERFTFDHHQVQEALYGALPPQLSREYHAALAEALELRTGANETEPETLDGELCVDLCRHYLQGTRGESALRYLKPALEHLSKGYLHAPAVALSERALAVPDLLVGDARVTVLLDLASSLEVLGKRGEQRAAIDRAVVLADARDDVGLRARAHRLLGHVLERDLENDAAMRELERARELARQAGDKKTECAAINCASSVLEQSGRYAEAEASLRGLVQLARETGDLGREADATGSLGLVLYRQGRYPEALEHYERDLALGREMGDRRREALALGGLGCVLWAQGRLAEALEHHERHLAFCRETGDRRGEALAMGNLGVAYASGGRFFAAHELCERHLSLCREVGDRGGEASATGNLGASLEHLGRPTEAAQQYHRHLALSRELGLRRDEARALLCLGGVLREMGQTGASEQHLDACLATCDELGLSRLGLAAQLALGSLRAAGSCAEGAREALTASRNTARGVGFPEVEVLARCELALLPGGDAEDARSGYVENESRLDADVRCEALLLLFRATGDHSHLVEAKRLLDELLAKNPPEVHDSMLKNVRLNREIMEAWAEHGEKAGSGAGAD